MTARSSFGRASFRWPQNPVDSTVKIGGHKIRLKLPFWGIPEIFAFAVTTAHEDTSRARTTGQLDVAMAIADNEGSMQVDGVLLGSALEHARLWLAAIAAIGRSVRAVVYGVEMGPGGFELLGHEFMDRVYQRFRKIAAADARLVCHHNHSEPSPIQAANGISNTRQDTKSADVIQVADFFGNGAVAIEKNRGAEYADVRQNAPPSTISTVARPLLRRRA
jgi:hypothetical protein